MQCLALDIRSLFYHASVVMLFRSKTSILCYFLFLYKFSYYIIQNVLVNKKIENWIFI